MEMAMRKSLIGLAMAGVLGTSLVAVAGLKYVSPVYVSVNPDGSGTMGGDLSSTRNSADAIARIGCYYENFGPPPYGPYKYASCYGYDGARMLACSTSDPAVTDTIAHLSGDSYLWIQVNAYGECTRVQIAAQSYIPPKAP